MYKTTDPNETTVQCYSGNQRLNMEQWRGKVAVVTGASSGIGEAICKDLALADVIVVGMARRVDRLNKLKQTILEKKLNARFYGVQCDITVESEIKTAFEYVVKTLGGVDILVNNAGIVKMTNFFAEDNLDTLKSILDTNLVGLISCTKKAFQSMSDRDVPGYIINISSVAGHSVPNLPGLMNVYPSSKHAVTALNTVMRHELNFLKKNKIRVSNVSPGGVRTEIIGQEMDLKSLPEGMYMLESEDVSDTVLYLLGTDPRVQVEDVIIRPVGEDI